MKKLLLIANPAAGRGTLKLNTLGILETFAKFDILTAVYFTEKRGDALRIARDAFGYDIIAACGGDGTLHEVVNGFLARARHAVNTRLPEHLRSDNSQSKRFQYDEPAPPLGYIPMGTANDFASTWELSGNPRAAAVTVATGVVNHVDLGVLNKRAFTYVASFGLFCGASVYTPRPLKAIFGKLAYYAHGLGELINIPRYELKINVDGADYGGVYSMGLFSNSFSVGGGISYPRNYTNLTDGKFEIILLQYINDIPKLIDVVLQLSKGNYISPYVTFLRGSNITIGGDKLSWIVDGEEYGGCRDATLRCLPRYAEYITDVAVI